MFKDYIAQVVKNSKAMAAALLSKGYTLVSGNLTSIHGVFLIPRETLAQQAARINIENARQ